MTGDDVEGTGREHDTSKRSRVRFTPAEGKEWNPLRGYPRNAMCWCGSDIKAKKCCLRNLAICVTADDAVKLREFMRAKAEVDWHTNPNLDSNPNLVTK